jgi:hypothetical protein
VTFETVAISRHCSDRQSAHRRRPQLSSDSDRTRGARSISIQCIGCSRGTGARRRVPRRPLWSQWLRLRRVPWVVNSPPILDVATHFSNGYPLLDFLDRSAFATAAPGHLRAAKLTMSAEKSTGGRRQKSGRLDVLWNERRVERSRPAGRLQELTKRRVQPSSGPGCSWSR